MCCKSNGPGSGDKVVTEDRRVGFTLMELLVAISIITIMAAMLYPVFARARDKGRQAVCISNLKQLGLACLEYVQDYDDVWFGQDNVARYPGYLWPYVKSRGVFRCPSDTAREPVHSGPTAGYQVISYSENANLYPIVQSRLTSPAATVVFFECGTLNLDPTITAVPNCVASLGGCWWPPYSANGCSFSAVDFPCAEHGGFLEAGPMGGTRSVVSITNVSNGNPNDPAFPLGRHTGGSCYAFADGHAKWLPGPMVSTGAQCVSNGIPVPDMAYSGGWWADSPKTAQAKGMVTFAYQ